jgi:hypothetical protein
MRLRLSRGFALDADRYVQGESEGLAILWEQGCGVVVPGVGARIWRSSGSRMG